jgi:WD40 repeat protein
MYKCELDQLSYFYPPIYLAAMMIRRTLFLAFVCFVVSCASAFAQKPELVVQTGHNTDFIQQIAFSPNGKILATAGFFDKNIKLWHVETGKELASLELSKALVGYNSLEWKQHTLHLSSGGWSAINIQYDVEEKKILNSVPLKLKKGLRNGFYNADASLLCFSSDSTVETDKNINFIKKDSVTILETTTGNIKAVLPLSGKTVGIFSADGKFLMTNDNQKHISIWDAKTFQFIRSLPIEANKIANLICNPDSRKVAICLNDTTIQISIVWTFNPIFFLSYV